MFKKLLALGLVIMTVFALMIPAFAGAETVKTTTRTLDDGTKLVYNEHLLQPNDGRIGRLSVRYENGTKYVEEYSLLPYEEWVDGHYNKHCKDNVNRTVKVYGANGQQIFEYGF